MLASFLQSRAWEEFQRAMGRKTWWPGGLLLIRHDMPLGMNFLYCPRPGWGDKKQETRDKFFEDAARIAREEKSIFLKIDPADECPISGIRQYASESLQPRQTVIVDLRRTEDEMLRGMHEKTRYNIRLAERKGVSMRYPVTSMKGATDVLWRLLQETAARDEFAVHARRHYEALLAVRSDDFSNELFFAEYQGDILAAAMVNFYRPHAAATYLHGASSRHHREVMAPHLLHWRIMQEAKSRGCLSYDFWGVDEVRWPGMTRFKRGFGGQEFCYPQSIDMVYRPVLYRAAQLWKKFWRT